MKSNFFSFFSISESIELSKKKETQLLYVIRSAAETIKKWQRSKSVGEDPCVCYSGQAYRGGFAKVSTRVSSLWLLMT